MCTLLSYSCPVAPPAACTPLAVAPPPELTLDAWRLWRRRWWPLDDIWYAARVLKVFKSGKHQLEYLDDGLKESVHLSDERYRECVDPRYAGLIAAAEAMLHSKAVSAASKAEEDRPLKARDGRPSNVMLNAPVTPASERHGGTDGAGDAAGDAPGPDGLSGADADVNLPSPKTPSEEKGECARTVGRSLIVRYRQQRRENQALRRASLTTSTIMTPSYWQGAQAVADSSLQGGSVASRGQRSQKRKLASTLMEVGGSSKRKKKNKGADGDGADDDERALSMNELRRTKKLIFGKSAIHSWGLYAAEPIEKEDFVVECATRSPSCPRPPLLRATCAQSARNLRHLHATPPRPD